MGTKEQVLALLESHKGQYLSGEELAGELALSRTAVWKAINSLRAAGYEIQAAQNRGYCLNACTDVLSVRRIENNLESAAAECTLELIPCTASTNSLLRQRAAEGAPEGLVILANQQTRGRGRLGREFYSPPDTGVYMSILLRPRELRPMRAVHITTMAAVAACAAISEQTQKAPQIKWVNDILLGGKKVCGILTEGSFNLETGQLEDVVLGIGFNVYPPAGGFPAELADTADSILFEQTDEGKNRLAASFLNHFFRIYRSGDAADYVRAYREKSMVIGKTVRIITPDGERTAHVLDIDRDCRLVVRYEDGSIEQLSSAQISICADADTHI